MGCKHMEYIKKLPRKWIKLHRSKCVCLEYAKRNNTHKYLQIPSYETIKQKNVEFQ